MKIVVQQLVTCDFGHGFDWRDYENYQGYSHLEELQNVDSESYTRIKELLLREILRLDYLIEFQIRVQSYLLDILRKVAKQSGFPRLPLIKELDFSTNMVGQRLAKHASN
jgi:hypothetical protein